MNPFYCICKLPRLAVGALALLIFGGATIAHGQSNDRDPFEEKPMYFNNKRVGERLSISFPNAPTDTSRSTEMVLFEEGYYDTDAGKYDRRLIALITGMGLGSKGLKLVVDDNRQFQLMRESLVKFERTYRRFKDAEDLIREKTEDWMGESWEALNEGRQLGEVYFYPSRKEMGAHFNWDFELERVWLSMGNQINIDREVVPYLVRMVDRINDYQSWFYDFRETTNDRNKEIDEILGTGA